MKLSIREICLVALFTALTTVGAFLKIPLPSITITLQFLFTTLAGTLLGAKLGGISVTIYILLGLIGIPVFTSGAGINYVFYPTFGYLVGFAIGAYVTGLISHKNNSPSFIRLFLANFTGLIVVNIIGVFYYYFITNYYMVSLSGDVSTDAAKTISLQALFLYVFLPPFPKDVGLCFVATILGKRLIPVLKNIMENK